MGNGGIRWLALPAVVLFAVVGCSSGDGGPGGTRSVGGGSSAPSTPPDTSGGTVTNRLAWAPASGPVDAYRVYVQRDGGSFQFEQQVGSALVAVTGQVGHAFRLQVSAVDATGNEGPLSPPSKQILFLDRSGLTGSSGGSSATASAGPPPASRAIASRESAPPEPAGEEPAPGRVVGVRDDIDGDGRADLVWASQDGTQLRVTGSDLGLELELTSPGPGWSLFDLADFDGDGRADLLWQSELGSLALSPASALLSASGEVPLEPFAELVSGERLVALGDYDGDARADVLVGLEAGGASLWLGRAGGVFEVVALPAPEPGASLVAGSGDHDGDGNTDVVWRTAGATLEVLYLVDGRVDGSSELTSQDAAAIVATGDFDADGTDELLVRENGALVAQRTLDADDRWLAGADDAESRAPAGCADYDGDGTTDLVGQSGDQLHFQYLPGDELEAADPGWVLLSTCL